MGFGPSATTIRHFLWWFFKALFRPNAAELSQQLVRVLATEKQEKNLHHLLQISAFLWARSCFRALCFEAKREPLNNIEGHSESIAHLCLVYAYQRHSYVFFAKWSCRWSRRVPSSWKIGPLQPFQRHTNCVFPSLRKRAKYRQSFAWSGGSMGKITCCSGSPYTGCKEEEVIGLV